jgi:hypothetical protein
VVDGAEIRSFYIQATIYGIHCNATTRVSIANNIIEGSHIGIYAKGNMSHLTIVNNNILGNTENGIHLYTYGVDIDNLILLNNIIALNGGCGVFNNNTNAGTQPEGVLYYEITHNNFTGNNLGSCCNASSIRPISCDDPSNISENPEFAANYCLQPTSPCINTGRQGLAFNDPDNSINDMGAYGGPWAIGCYFSGPVVTELSVSPGAVEEGNPVTIRATGVAR